MIRPKELKRKWEMNQIVKMQTKNATKLYKSGKWMLIEKEWWDKYNEDLKSLSEAVEAYQRTNEKINEANKVLSQVNQEMSEKYKALIESIKRGTAHRVLS